MGKSQSSISISSLITALLVLGVTSFLIINSIKALGGTYIEDTWHLTQGTILDPDLQLKGKENIERRTQGLEQTINYEYTVDGVTYRSNSVAKEAFVDPKDFPEGKVVDVYYNPDDPADSVLQRSLMQKHFLYVVIGFCFLLIGTVFYYFIKNIRGG